MNYDFIKKPKIFIPLIILAIIAGGFIYFNRSKTPDYEFAVVSKGTIVQEVSVTGKVEPAESVDLAFEKSGRVSYIYVGVGDKISAGRSLARLDNSELIAQLNEAKANVEIQKAELDELKRGTRTEEITVKESELKKAQKDLDNYYAGAIDVLNDAYAKADDAVRTKTDELFTNDDSDNPQLTFSVTESQIEINVKNFRALSTFKLNKWHDELRNININSQEEIEQALKNAKDYLNTFREFLLVALNATDKSAGVAASTISAYKTNIGTGRTNVNTAFTNVSSQEQNIFVQKITVEKIQNELNLKLAGAVSEQIVAQEAQVKSVEAKAQNIQAQLEKTVIYSPINGVIAKQDAKIGEIVSANTPIISIISEADFEIKANVPEADIAKIKLSDKAKITLDAYGDDVVFEAKAVEIDPAETLIEGVATYKVVLHFINGDNRIKSGMTANIEITTAKKENIIVVPQRAVTIKDNRKTVKILQNDKENNWIETEVETGLRGSDGNVEIIKGINEGDKVIVFLKEK